MFEQFDLFCDDEIQIELTFTFVIIGALVGSILLTPIGERVGRKPYFLVNSWTTALICLGQGFSPSIKVFHALSFFRGFFFQVDFQCFYLFQVKLKSSIFFVLGSIFFRIGFSL